MAGAFADRDIPTEQQALVARDPRLLPHAHLTRAFLRASDNSVDSAAALATEFDDVALAALAAQASANHDALQVALQALHADEADAGVGEHPTTLHRTAAIARINRDLPLTSTPDDAFLHNCVVDCGVRCKYGISMTSVANAGPDFVEAHRCLVQLLAKDDIIEIARSAQHGKAKVEKHLTRTSLSSQMLRNVLHEKFPLCFTRRGAPANFDAHSAPDGDAKRNHFLVRPTHPTSQARVNLVATCIEPPGWVPCTVLFRAAADVLQHPERSLEPPSGVLVLSAIFETLMSYAEYVVEELHDGTITELPEDFFDTLLLLAQMSRLGVEHREGRLSSEDSAFVLLLQDFEQPLPRDLAQHLLDAIHFGAGDRSWHIFNLLRERIACTLGLPIDQVAAQATDAPIVLHMYGNSIPCADDGKAGLLFKFGKNEDILSPPSCGDDGDGDDDGDDGDGDDNGDDGDDDLAPAINTSTPVKVAASELIKWLQLSESAMREVLNMRHKSVAEIIAFVQEAAREQASFGPCRRFQAAMSPWTEIPVVLCSVAATVELFTPSEALQLRNDLEQDPFFGDFLVVALSCEAQSAGGHSLDHHLKAATLLDVAVTSPSSLSRELSIRRPRLTDTMYLTVFDAQRRDIGHRVGRELALIVYEGLFLRRERVWREPSRFVFWFIDDQTRFSLARALANNPDDAVQSWAECLLDDVELQLSDCDIEYAGGCLSTTSMSRKFFVLVCWSDAFRRLAIPAVQRIIKVSDMARAMRVTFECQATYDAASETASAEPISSR